MNVEYVPFKSSPDYYYIMYSGHTVGFVYRLGVSWIDGHGTAHETRDQAALHVLADKVFRTER